MARELMYQPKPWTLFEMTSRCRQARFLLKPGHKANRRLIGCLARSLELGRGNVHIHLVGMTSNHLHIIGAARTVEDKAAFKCHFKTNLSKELGKLYKWDGGIFSHRSRDIPIDDDALEDRLVYLAGHGVKEGLVAHPYDWPGVQWLRHLTEGTKLTGEWIDRTAFCRAQQAWQARKRGTKPKLKHFTTRKFVRLDPLPHLLDEPISKRQAFWADIVERAAKSAPDHPPLGVEKVLAADPHDAPSAPKSSPSPRIHTRSLARLKARREEYAAFVEQYRATLERLLLGEPIDPDCALRSQACFPRGLPLTAH